MKRAFIALILALLILPDASGAAPRQKRAPKRPKAVPERTIDRDADADRDRPQRGPNVKKERKSSEDAAAARPGGPVPVSQPIEMQLTRGASRRFDLRALPATRPDRRERPELEPPDHTPVTIDGGRVELPPAVIPSLGPVPTAAAPPPNVVFEGLDREFWGAGSPPDTTGDVGPQYYIQAVNTSVGVYDKSGNQQAAFTFDTLMSQGNFGNLCDTDNFGDPVVLYDSFEDRWVLTDFAFVTDGGGNAIAPAFQCFAVSQTNNPLVGGWHFYSIQINDYLNDYEKLAIWPDGIYMSANMYGFGGGSFSKPRAWAFNKMQMYAGSPTVQVVAFDMPSGDFAVMPSNARLQTGTPPAGRPNLFISSWLFTNALTVYKFHVDWGHISLSTFTGPDTPIAATSWPNAAVANVPQPGTANLLDALQLRAMIQNQYTNFGGTESLWIPHTVRRGNTTGFAAPRWYQVDVSGGNVNLAIPQAATWDPDGANVMHRFMPSLAVDRAGNMAMGYSISNGTTMFPSIAYAGRLASDPVNTFGQTETMMFTGTASQTTSSRWGDYTTMSLDPDGCTFWYTNEYANPADQSAARRWKTKIGSFAYPSCVPVGAGGTVTGTVTVTPGGAPVSGATVTFGVRSTTTNGAGVYSFLNIPAGTYPSISATKPGYSTAGATSIVVTDGGTTIHDFALTVAPASACLTDTTQADFQTGELTNVDITTTPGDVTLMNIAVDQQNQAGTTTGTGFGTPNWTGQTFIPSLTGQLLRVESTIFCNGCGAAPPNLTLSVRATAAGLPTGADLASVTIPGANYASGATVTFMATFGAPATLTAGTQYALIMRPASAPAGSGYFWIRSSPSTYASGSRVLSADSGGTWSADTTRDYNFKAVMAGSYNPTSGNVVSATKDSNPAGGLTPIWSTLSWNGTTPANTTLQFQVAGSNNPNGPFNFIGPDGTAGTFYTTSPGTLDPLYNLRYAKYKAYLATTNNAVTPVLNDVTLCTSNVDCSGAAATITPAPASVCENSTGNTASGPAGMTSYSWSISNGTITSATNIQSITYTAGASGNVQLTLAVVSPSGCRVSGSVNVPINVTPAQPTIAPGGPTTFCAGGSVTLTSSSATGNQWSLDGNPIGGATSQNYVATASGSYTVVVSNGGCPSAPSAATVVTVTPAPPTPTITPGGPTTFCAGSSVTLTSSSASGNQWSLNGNPIGGETNQTLVVTTSGNYTVVVTASGCPSAPSAGTVVTVNPIPNTPTISPSGPTTFCAGGSVTLTSNSATGNQWSLDGNPIGGATSQNYVATASGSYTVVVTQSGCPSAPSAATVVTVNPTPATPTISPSGPTAFCTGGSVTLTSSSASGNQWSLNGSPIGGATAQNYLAAVAGDYTVTVTASGCPSAPSAPTTVTINPDPDATITAPGSVVSGSTGNAASVANAGIGATYAWSVTNGTITAGTGTASITFTAGAAGALTLNVTVTTGAGCSDSGSANVTVTAAPPAVTVTSVTPATGSSLGGTSVTITGTGFNPGATVTFGGSAATDVVRVNATTITAKTPAHASGAVNVTVTNTNTTNGTLTNGFTYFQQNFDANGDSMIDPSDIFYLINYLFLSGPAPAGAAGPVLSGDANGDGVVDPSDIFYVVFYLFTSGPAPHIAAPGGVRTLALEAPVAGQLSLGRATLRNGRWVVPVIATLDRDSAVPQALSMRVRFEGNASDVTVRRAGALAPVFEVSRGAADAMSYLVAFGESLSLDASRSAVVAEIELRAAGPVRLAFDPAVTMLAGATGARAATVGNGALRTSGTVIEIPAIHPGTPRRNQ